MNANDLFKAVTELDLEPIKMKLMHVESGEGWSPEKANAVEKEYRRFLCLMKLFPDEIIAPLVDVDTFWHYHILDTMKYAADCEKAFGYFLHHYPYLGMHDEDDEQIRLDSADRMGELYESIFGETYPGSRLASQVTEAHADYPSPAFCAGPRAEAAFCAGPRAEAAFCAGPRTQAAFCAGPRAKADSASNDGAISAVTAFCAGPRAKTAFCAGPRAKTAFCAGPRAKADSASRSDSAISAATAFCAGPRAKAAFCAGPRVKAAFCAGPRSRPGTQSHPAAC